MEPHEFLDREQYEDLSDEDQISYYERVREAMD